ERDPGLAECQMDHRVIDAVAGEAVHLVDDAVVDLVLLDVAEEALQLGPVRGFRGLARGAELGDDRSGGAGGLPGARGARRGEREALVAVTTGSLLAGRDAQVGDSGADERLRRNRCGHRRSLPKT